MLPLVGQKLALQDENLGTSLMSACIIAAQIVMVPMAMLVGAKADRWGRKPLFLAALLILPIRGALYTLSDNDVWLVGVQLLDGVGAGIFGAIFPVIVADLMRGTGRFNVAQGAIITAQEHRRCAVDDARRPRRRQAGYSAAFLTLAAIAVAGLLLFRSPCRRRGTKMRSASIAASAECIVESDARLPHHDARGYPLGWMSYFCCAAWRAQELRPRSPVPAKRDRRA